MRRHTLPMLFLGAVLLWVRPLTAQDAFTLSNALVAKENVQRFCGKLVVYSQNTNQEARPVLMALFETPENRVYDDITQSGNIPLTEYLDKVNSQLATLSFGLIPQPNRFMVASKNGKHYFVIEVDKEVNDRRVKNIFVVNAINQKIVNIYESLTAVPLQLKPFELLADAPGQASTQTPTQPPATDPDLEAYQTARQANTAAAYQRYLSNYPNGRFRAEAQLFAGQLNATTNQTTYSPASTSGFTTFTETVNGVSFKMVAIKGGTFQMGSNEGEDDEKPVHSVTVSNFYMGKHEVTQKQWQTIMSSNPSRFKGNNLPVEKVSWDDIQVFLQKLNQKTGKKYRLPTEAEWEYAAGGGTTSRTKYAGADNESSLKDYAWYDDNSNSQIHPVGTKSPNGLGLYDMSGNVWEWCSDWYGRYSSGSQTNPQGPSRGSYRVFRGGSWDDYRNRCHRAFRYYRTPEYRDLSLGFRVALAP